MTAGQVPTVLASGMEFEGVLAFRGAARIDGRLSGGVVAEGSLVIGEGAQVRARVEVDELIVAGDLEGEILARKRAELRNTGRVVGSLRCPRLAVAEGGILEGRCETLPEAESS